ncbi:MAG: hypothetical protein SGBAC_013055 [Bacillariaceae sp.]
MKLQKMFRPRSSGARRKASILRKLQGKLKKEESIISSMTDISSDTSSALPDPSDLGSASCIKKQQQDMKEERQDAAKLQGGSESRAMVPTEQEQSNSVVDVLNSFFCLGGGAPMPQLAKEGATNQANNHAQTNNARELPIQESVECVYDEVSEMALIQPASEAASMESTKPQAPTTDADHAQTTATDTPPKDSTLWPQAPLLFRAAPNSGMEILGIRRDDSETYLWTPQQSSSGSSSSTSSSWWKLLDGQHDQEPTQIVDKDCWILPINNGREAIGKSLVVDFQSKLFQGSILIRLKDAPGISATTSEEDYFTENPPLRFQVTIRGKFRESLQWSNLLTGLRLRRKLGKVPSKWFLWTILKVVHFFAPQLQTKLDSDEPYALSPLGSAPRTVTINSEKPTDLLAADREEPTTKEESVTGKVYPIKDPLARARARKKEFDQRFQAQDESYCTGVDKTYTFQFLQHLLDYHTSNIDLGSFHHDMNDILDGQPFQVMAEHNGEPLWMFEIWNESMVG